MEGAGVVNIVTAPHTEDKDLEVEAVIVRGGTVRARPAGDRGLEIAARGPGTGAPGTGGPDRDLGGGPALLGEDQGIGELKLFNRCETTCFQQFILLFLLLLLRQPLQLKFKIQIQDEI